MKLESFFPGRLRVRSALFMKQENIDKIHQFIDAIDGVKKITGNPQTGSITVLYNPAAITMPMLMQAKDELERLEAELR